MSTQLLYTSGFLFMGATEEQMNLLTTAGVSHVSYILILYSVSFLLFLFVTMLLQLYATYAWPIDNTQSMKDVATMGNGHVLGDNQRLRDAEEFELEGLMSGDEEVDEGAVTPKYAKENGRAT